MKRILVTAGGTATAWHIAQIINHYYSEAVEIQLCDTNEPYLVPAVVCAKKVHRVPTVKQNNYMEIIGTIVDEEKIDCIIPLIPQEAYLFAADGEFAKSHKVISAAPTMKTVDLLADKMNMFSTLRALEIPTPMVYGMADIDKEKLYLLKPRLGFGSAGVELLTGAEIKREKERIIQEYCHDDDYDEITVEVYNGKAGLHIFARRRIETKAGVCVKMEQVDDKPFFPYIEKLVNHVACPIAFNVQFLWHKKQWKLFDCNLRLGAGTALSSAIGFQLTRALIAELSGEVIDKQWFNVDKDVKSVLRVYQEIIVK